MVNKSKFGLKFVVEPKGFHTYLVTNKRVEGKRGGVAIVVNLDFIKRGIKSPHCDCSKGLKGKKEKENSNSSSFHNFSLLEKKGSIELEFMLKRIGKKTTEGNYH
tara:strand:- start:97 stop:411 length:315 start_codon:yes stop_codon:yes gene_type:complete